MGDKSPKAKQRDKNQKTAATDKAKKDHASRQAAFTTTVVKAKK